MALKKSLFTEKGYSKHKNGQMSALANSLVSLADGEIDKVTLANTDNKIKFTITEKEADSDLFDMEREAFKASLKSNTGVLPYYISEYFGNKEVPRYLSKGEAAYAMTVNPELELLGVKAGKGGSTIISKEPISLENSEAYNKYKTFMTIKAADTPSIDKVLAKFEDFEGTNYEDVLISESEKIYNQMVAEQAKEEQEAIEKGEVEDCNPEISGSSCELDPDNYFDGQEDIDKDEDDDDGIVEAIAHDLTMEVSDDGEEIDTDSEVIEDIAEVSKDNIEEDEENQEADTYEDEVLKDIQ